MKNMRTPIIFSLVVFFFVGGLRNVISDSEILVLPKANNRVIIGLSPALTIDDAIAAYEAKDYKKSVKILIPLATQGVAKAQYRLGVHYYLGLGIGPDDKLAIEWLQRAADQGDPEALIDLGEFYHKGEIVKKDSSKAVTMFRRAALLGHDMAQFT